MRKKTIDFKPIWLSMRVFGIRDMRNYIVAKKSSYTWN